MCESAFTDNRDGEVMVTDVMIGVYFRHMQWLSPGELDMSSTRRSGFDAKTSKLGFRLEEEATGQKY
jgi:hypothetical protein